MFHSRLYYRLKPFLPRAVRLGVRRWFAVRKRQRVSDVWPILPGSETPPAGWPGWPEGKQFAFVLTHDVEGPKGLAKVRPLAELEMKLGFRSSFNFIPEGAYRVPDDLRQWLVNHGFEVGVHDLYHDGRLFSSRAKFLERAAAINCYLKEWGAVGFRAGFMLNQIDWIHHLDIQYDASTFDTDPFEPQPKGQNTIFPFWIPAPDREKAEGRRPKAGTTTSGSQPSAFSLQPSGYVELPYTLPQDSTLFLILRESGPGIWCRKLDWIAKHGGMVLVNVHPDYLRFGGEGSSPYTFTAVHYRHLLEFCASTYSGYMWARLPREVATFARTVLQPTQGPHESRPRLMRRVRPLPAARPKIWIDLDNTPHVLFFEPIIEELRNRGCSLYVTARDAFQVFELAESHGLNCIKVGRHYGKHKLAKGYGLVYRALQLMPGVLRERPVLGVSHGSRSQLIACKVLRFSSLLIEDYEYARFPWPTQPEWVLAPDAIPAGALPQAPKRVRAYHGLKEGVYTWKLKPDRDVLSKLGIKNGEIVITVRPPATEAHYHNPESEVLFNRFMDRATRTPQVRVVLLPRNRIQADALRAQHPAWFGGPCVTIPTHALDGLNLIWHSDLVVSGGGTMNREAAALGVPVYSIFRGRLGAVDQQLSRQGRLTLIRSTAEVDRLIRIGKRPVASLAATTSRQTLLQVVDVIVELAERCVGKYRPLQTCPEEPLGEVS